MIPGAPVQSRWLRAKPRRLLPARVLEDIVGTAFPRCRLVDVQPCADGFRNANFRLRLDSIPGFVVLRIYEHDPSLCTKEVDLLNLIKHSVPVPAIIHAEPEGLNEIPPFVFMPYVEGISLRELKRNGNHNSIAQAAYSAGQTLALISRTTFNKSGWLGPGPAVGAPLLEGANSGPRFVDSCLASGNSQLRLGPELTDQIHTLVWSYAPELAALDDERCLVHGDFGKRNLFVQQVKGEWRVAAVLDWEFAISGSPLTDVGHFLRYECASCPVAEPHFSEGYLHAGGRLPDEWRRLARVLDLIALCESLTHNELPDDVVAELVDLVRATVENRDPRFD
jgi:aminoglycoside phosphotransferase (APT) family kinase protein